MLADIGPGETAFGLWAIATISLLCLFFALAGAVNHLWPIWREFVARRIRYR